METSLKEKIIKLRKEGKSYGEIKKELNCSKATISFHCKNEALNNIGLDQSKKLKKEEIDKLKDFYKTHTIKETSVEFEVSETTVKKYVENKRFVYDTDDDKRKANYRRVKSFRNRLKERAVEYKGGKCVLCGYNRCIKSFDFHHLDPKEKDFTIGSNSSISWDKLKIELDKCVLLCANCHREVHAGYTKLNCSLIGKAPL